MLPIFLATALCVHTPTEFRCVTYVNAYDGDTITVNIEKVHPLLGKRISVRVRGIDTPEMRGEAPCEKERALEAREVVRGLLKDSKDIRLVNVGRDKYFRILADVVVDKKSLKDELLKRKLAYLYEGGTKEKRSWCK